MLQIILTRMKLTPKKRMPKKLSSLNAVVFTTFIVKLFYEKNNWYLPSIFWSNYIFIFKLRISNLYVDHKGNACGKV